MIVLICFSVWLASLIITICVYAKKEVSGFVIPLIIALMPFVNTFIAIKYGGFIFGYISRDWKNFLKELRKKDEGEFANKKEQKKFESTLSNEWKNYVDSCSATVDALEDNTQELAFSKGFYRGYMYGKRG